MSKHETTALDVLAVLDIDRTLFDDAKFMERLSRFGEHYGIPYEEFHRSRRKIEETDSFDGLWWLAERLGDKFTLFQTDFLTAHKAVDFVFKDAHILLDVLNKLEIPSILMTHGSRKGQEFKIATSERLGGYDHIVIDAPNKGERLQAVYDAKKQHYTLKTDENSVYTPSRVILVDDKARNFAGLAPDAPVLGLHVAGRARSGNDIALDFKPKILPGDRHLTAAPALIRQWLGQTAG